MENSDFLFQNLQLQICFFTIGAGAHPENVLGRIIGGKKLSIIHWKCAYELALTPILDVFQNRIFYNVCSKGPDLTVLRFRNTQ